MGNYLNPGNSGFARIKNGQRAVLMYSVMKALCCRDLMNGLKKMT